MMQQVATSSSKIAVNDSLNIMTGVPSAKETHSREFNEGRSAFEDAIARAENGAWEKNNRSAIQDQNQALPKAERAGKSNGDDGKFFTQPGVVRPVKQDLRGAESLDNKPTENEGSIEKADLGATSLGVDSSNIHAEAAEQTLALEQEATQGVSESTTAQALKIEDTLAEFDYVNFVSQIKSLNTEPVDASNELTDGLENDEQALDLANVSLNQEELQVILDAQKAGVDLTESLSQEQLDKLDAAITNMLTQYHQQTAEKQQSLEQTNVLNANELVTDVDTNTDAALDKALVQAIIQQPIDNAKLAVQANIDAENPINEQTDIDASKLLNKQDNAELDASKLLNKQANAELDASKLLNKQANAELDASKLLNEQAIAELDAKAVPNLNEVNAASAMFETAASMTDSNSEVAHSTSKEISSEEMIPKEFLSKGLLSPEQAIEEALLAKDANQERIIDTVQNTEKAAITNVSASTNIETQVQVKSTSDDTQALVKQLALLDERSQTNTIENIKSRVEKFAADLSANAKGNEFVAALQSGLKEFKEQMQSGREPGIDLKALVSDALAQANVEIPAQNQANVDKALTQFGAIMNLANSVNQSTQAQAQQLFGMTETQMIKESNVLHAEGTKLAQQAASNFDKAVNIFKPEGQQQLAEKVRWMVAGRNPMAEIRLDPPDLGAMQIKVNLGTDTASVNFTVQSSQAKEALDQQLPKLREMLQEQGIELGQSSVQQENSGQAQQQAQQGSGQAGNSLAGGQLASQSAEALPQGVIEQRVVGGSLGGIDYYA